MTTQQISAFSRINEDILWKISEFLENPNEILCLRELFAKVVLGLTEKDGVRVFIESRIYWYQYFSQRFSRVEQVRVHESQSLPNLCERVCHLASRFYGYCNPYKPIRGTSTDTITIDTDGLYKRINDILSSGYEQCLIQSGLLLRAGLELNSEELVGLIRCGMQRPSSYAACRELLYHCREKLQAEREMQLYSVMLADTELLSYFLKKQSASIKAIQKALELDNTDALTLFLTRWAKDGIDINAVLDLALASTVATDRDNAKTVQLLLQKGATIKSVEEDGATPLHKAASADIARLLLVYGAPIDAIDHQGRTPLHGAADLDDIQTVQLLLEKGASVTIVAKDGSTPLHKAASADIARLLLDYGAPIDAVDHEGKTALFAAADIQTVQLLLEKGASVTVVAKDGSTPLHMAACAATVNLLLDYGADIQAKNTEGNTPLHSAMINKHPEVAQALLKREADLYAQNVSKWISAGPGIQDRASIDAIDDEGKTLLHRTASLGDIQTVQLLLERGASVTIVAKDGSTPLHMAASRRDTQIAPLLLERGTENGAAPLHKVAGADIVRLLLDYGAPIDVVDEDGSTPLHGAACAATVNLLLDCGADIQAKNANGETPLHTAVISRQLGAVWALLKRGADPYAQGFLNRTPIELVIQAGWSVRRIDGKLALAPRSPDVVEVKKVKRSTTCTLSEKRQGWQEIFQILFSKKIPRFNELMINPEKVVSDLISQFYGYSKSLPWAEEILLPVNNWEENELYSLLKKGLNAGYEQFFHRNQSALQEGNLEQGELRWLAQYGVEQPHRHDACRAFLTIYRSALLLDEDFETQDGLQFWSVILKDIELLRWTLQQQEEVDARAVERAVQDHNVEACAVFLDKGVDAGLLLSDEQTLLHIAVKEGAPVTIVQLLLEAGASAGAVDNKDQTPLHWAVIVNNLEVAHLLLEKEANTQAKTADGLILLGLAKSEEMKQLLHVHGVPKRKVSGSPESESPAKRQKQ